MKASINFLFLAAIAGLTLSFSGFRPCIAAEKGKGVEFYLLEDEKMNFEAARDLPLKDLKLQADPWIAADNIERYDWSCHYVYFKKPVDIPNQKGAKYVNLAGKPFVVVADGTRCYMGTLQSDVSSHLPMGSVAMIRVRGDKMERFPITLFTALFKGETAKDMRDNPALKEALKRNGLLHAGLECTLDGISAKREKDSLAVVYTYTLQNNSQDDLYVLDPEKFHTALFHDYQNGVTARDLDHGDNNYYFWPNPREGEPKYVLNKDLSWYTRLEKGKSLTRTVQMNLSPRMPPPGVQTSLPPPTAPQPGKYQFIFRFKGDTPNFSYGEDGSGNNNNQLFMKDNKLTADPKAADGRIWLGQLSAELLQNVK
jgi:hypothetical protein